MHTWNVLAVVTNGSKEHFHSTQVAHYSGSDQEQSANRSIMLKVQLHAAWPTYALISIVYKSYMLAYRAPSCQYCEEHAFKTHWNQHLTPHSLIMSAPLSCCTIIYCTCKDRTPHANSGLFGENVKVCMFCGPFQSRCPLQETLAVIHICWRVKLTIWCYSQKLQSPKVRVQTPAK